MKNTTAQQLSQQQIDLMIIALRCLIRTIAPRAPRSSALLREANELLVALHKPPW